MKETRYCLHCNQPFTCERSRPKKYCSNQCAAIVRGQNSRKQYPINICAACGKEFEHKRQDTEGKYCSRACSDKQNKSAHRRRPRIKKTCIICKKEYEALPWGEEQKFCSKECANLLKSMIRGENHPLYKQRVEKICTVCGKVCYVKPGLAKRFRTCSRLCSAYLSQAVQQRNSSIETAMLKALSDSGIEATPLFSEPPYWIDIALPFYRIAIECDGDYWHSTKRQKAIDKRKDSFLQSRGWRVIRFTESDIKGDVNACVARVIELITHVQSQPQ